MSGQSGQGDQPEPTQYQRFQKLTRALVAIPKHEVDQKRAEAKEARKRKKAAT